MNSSLQQQVEAVVANLPDKKIARLWRDFVTQIDSSNNGIEDDELILLLDECINDWDQWIQALTENTGITLQFTSRIMFKTKIITLVKKFNAHPSHYQQHFYINQSQQHFYYSPPSKHQSLHVANPKSPLSQQSNSENKEKRSGCNKSSKWWNKFEAYVFILALKYLNSNIV